ncbi:tRNA epoxyqueuosine(34) reductase QueG [Flavobacterium aciduliphilum]|uniref:Epoxyqueuosine reductase n=1 Tax=Flavobacterium aciduliphilum TaxID=1101402 RepID=A0A328YMD4_9FLAO|nr:tRNA epoxyqueuosine(34) reductase QueG [Flavobacterium aciduliphilum]RAR71727.1 epoxyqueuosine reductase [Flavobacterium aciduliphilum]
MREEKHTALIKAEAKRLGFISCGISKAGFLEEEAPRLENFLKQEMQGQMSYLERNFDKRLDPTLLVDDAKSVISLLYNYYPSEVASKESFKISKYAYGEDYHHVIKDKLKEFLDTLQNTIGAINGRAFVDSAPVLEKAWAAKSGLGWVGKNSNLITKKVGSFYFIAEIILDVALQYDSPASDHCGSCTACIDSCPTQAIVSPYVVDGSKCISYFTIELKDNLPKEMKGKFDDWIFGCDVCQDVCPWNSFSLPHQEPRFLPNQDWFSYSKKDWLDITEEVFSKTFKDSAIKRTKFEGLKRNIEFVSGRK